MTHVLDDCRIIVFSTPVLTLVVTQDAGSQSDEDDEDEEDDSEVSCCAGDCCDLFCD